MKLHVFVVRSTANVEDPYWVDGCWDEFTIDENLQGFSDAFDSLKAKHGEDNVRVLIVKVPVGSLEKAFAFAEVAGTPVKR